MVFFFYSSISPTFGVSCLVLTVLSFSYCWWSFVVFPFLFTVAAFRCSARILFSKLLLQHLFPSSFCHSSVKNAFGRWVRAPISACSGGQSFKPSFWWRPASGRCATSSRSLRRRSWFRKTGPTPPEVIVMNAHTRQWNFSSILSCSASVLHHFYILRLKQPPGFLLIRCSFIACRSRTNEVDLSLSRISCFGCYEIGQCQLGA